MRCDAGHIHVETSGVSPGLSRRRDRFGTEHGTSHNSIPPSRLHLEAWEGWSVPVPRCLVPRNKRRHGGGADQDSDMPSTMELVAAIVAANDSLVDLIRQQDQAKDTAVGSFRLGIGFWLTSGLPGSQSC